MTEDVQRAGPAGHLGRTVALEKWLNGLNSPSEEVQNLRDKVRCTRNCCSDPLHLYK